MPQPSIGVAILTYNGTRHLPHVLPPLLASPLQPRIIVVDPTSPDGTGETAQRDFGVEVMHLPRAEFNHGATRERARHTLGTDIVVMMTQDAYPMDADALGRLVAPIQRGDASLAYGRQLPRQDAGLMESFPRQFNYPPTSHVRSIDDAPRYGTYVFFCSNAFAAYHNAALDEIGGFRPTLSHEDAVAAAMLLKAGHRIAYVAEAQVRHSHRYTIRQELRRHWDAGYARAEFREALSFGGAEEKLGARFVKAMTATLWRQRPWLLPYAALHTAAKLIGYKLGQRSHRAPRWFKRAMSGQDYYWR